MTKFQLAIIGILTAATAAVIGVFCLLAWLVVVSMRTLITPSQTTLLVIATVTPYSAPPTPTSTPSPNKAVATLTERPQLTTRPTAEPQPTMAATVKYNIPPRKKYGHGFTIQETYDRIKGVTVVMLWPPRDFTKWTSKPANLVAGYAYPGTIPAPPIAVSFNLTTLIWWSYSCDNLALLLNGENRVQFDTKLTKETFPGEVTPRTLISTYLPLEDFLDIANANQVEGRVCSIDFAFSGEQLEALRDLASRMNP